MSAMPRASRPLPPEWAAAIRAAVAEAVRQPTPPLSARGPAPRPRNRRGRPLTFPHPWYELVEAAGGIDPLADRLHVSRRTLQRWAQGRITPPYAARRLANEVARFYGCALPYPSS
jgi:hypothetical protein